MANTPTANVPSLGAHFPQLVNTPSAYMEALIMGELIVENRCLRVSQESGGSVLLIWDPRFLAIEEGGIIKVANSNTGEILASVGDYVAVGGGFVDDPALLGLTERLPSDCPSPYYVVGETIQRVNRPQ